MHWAAAAAGASRAGQIEIARLAVLGVESGERRAARQRPAGSQRRQHHENPLLQGRLYKRAGVAVPASETGKTMPFHSLRHSFGTECARRGVPVMTLRDLMGHEDASTTQRYVTVTSADKRNAIERGLGQQVGNTLPKGAEDPQILVEKL
jgi:integrase